MFGARIVGTVVAVALVPAVAHGDHGYQYAKVLAADPIYQTVSYTVPVEQCTEQTVSYRDQPAARSATGPILGAIIGGALGNAVGHKKRNKQVGTVVGAVLGGTIGADISRKRRASYEPVRYGTEQVCRVVDEQRYEEQVTGYRVTYLYGGETYRTTMDRDPGSSLRVNVRVTPLG